MKSAFFALILLSSAAMAGVGEDLPLSRVPVAACMLALETKPFIDDRVSLEEVCSGVMISPVEFLTAGHCVDHIDVSKAKVYCPLNGKALSIEKVEPSPFHVKQGQDFPDEQRWRDVAKITLSSPALAPSVSIVRSEQETRELLASTTECAFFGFSQRLGQELKSPMYAQGVKVSPKSLRISEEHTIWLQGDRGSVSRVSQGDSGGGLACLQKGQWKFFGVTSAVDLYYRSIFANLALHGEFILPKKSLDYPVDHGVAAQKAVKEKLKAQEVATCWSSLEKAQPGLKRPAAVSLETSEVLCYQERHRLLSTNLGRVFKVQKFTPVFLDLTPSSLNIRGSDGEVMAEQNRLVTQGNPFSLVDLGFNRFLLKKIEGDSAYGDLRVLGNSDGFGCISMFLCREGVYKNIRLPWHRIDIAPQSSF
ncbi:Trypsin [compost metagenome]